MPFVCAFAEESSTSVQKAALERSFFVEHKFNHLADDKQKVLWYDKHAASVDYV